jgi:hypothetical protein
MFNRPRDESDGIMTLKLARGTIGGAKPPHSQSTLEDWISLGQKVSTNSSNMDTEQSAISLLDGFGVEELLAQEDRPTFIIDLENEANYNPGTLQIMFANASLRAHDSILGMVMGKADLDSPGVVVNNTFPEFKAWALSYVKNHESLDVSLPSFLYGGLTWTCSTLKKRL